MLLCRVRETSNMLFRTKRIGPDGASPTEMCPPCNGKVKHLNRDQAKVSLKGYEYVTRNLYASS